MKGIDYIDLLSANLLPYMQSMGPEFIFMDDNVTGLVPLYTLYSGCPTIVLEVWRCGHHRVPISTVLNMSGIF